MCEQVTGGLAHKGETGVDAKIETCLFQDLGDAPMRSLLDNKGKHVFPAPA